VGSFGSRIFVSLLISPCIIWKQSLVLHNKGFIVGCMIPVPVLLIAEPAGCIGPVELRSAVLQLNDIRGPLRGF
jgi:hypothetical protein